MFTDMTTAYKCFPTVLRLKTILAERFGMCMHTHAHARVHTHPHTLQGTHTQ